MNLTQRFQQPVCLSGNILLSHPSLRDPNFLKTVVFLSSHCEEDGTLGVILNRPTGQRLGELDKQFEDNAFADVPVFEGGPVEQEKLIVAGWEWLDSPSSFKLYFGIDLEKASLLRRENPDIHLSCFLGHSGWSPGQLENELDDDAWLVHNLDYDLFTKMENESRVWKQIVGSMSDELRLLADAPENPSQN